MQCRGGPSVSVSIIQGFEDAHTSGEQRFAILPFVMAVSPAEIDGLGQTGGIDLLSYGVLPARRLSGFKAGRAVMDA